MKPFEKLTYEQKIRWRLRLSWALLAAMLVYMVVVTELGGGDSREMSRLAGTVSRLIFFGGIVVVGTRIAHNRKLLRDIVLRRQQMLRERDERNRWLHDKSAALCSTRCPRACCSSRSPVRCSTTPRFTHRSPSCFSPFSSRAQPTSRTAECERRRSVHLKEEVGIFRREPALAPVLFASGIDSLDNTAAAAYT